MNLRIYYKYLSSRIASKWTVLLVDVIIVVYFHAFCIVFCNIGFRPYLMKFLYMYG